jgi:hypothetical protein
MTIVATKEKSSPSIYSLHTDSRFLAFPLPGYHKINIREEHPNLSILIAGHCEIREPASYYRKGLVSPHYVWIF